MKIKKKLSKRRRKSAKTPRVEEKTNTNRNLGLIFSRSVI